MIDISSCYEYLSEMVYNSMGYEISGKGYFLIDTKDYIEKHPF